MSAWQLREAPWALPVHLPRYMALDVLVVGSHPMYWCHWIYFNNVWLEPCACNMIVIANFTCVKKVERICWNRKWSMKYAVPPIHCCILCQWRNSDSDRFIPWEMFHATYCHKDNLRCYELSWIFWYICLWNHNTPSWSIVNYISFISCWESSPIINV